MANSVTDHFIFGTKDVAAAGTAVQLSATEYRLKTLTIIAHADNAGAIYYGGSDVDNATNAGLAAGESITITHPKPFTLGSIYIDSANNDDGVDFVAVRI